MRFIHLAKERVGRFLLVQDRIDLGHRDNQCGIVENIPNHCIVAYASEAMGQR